MASTNQISFTSEQLASITSVIHQVLQQQFDLVPLRVTAKEEQTQANAEQNEEKTTEKTSDSQAKSTHSETSVSAIPQPLLSTAPQRSGHHDTHRSEAPIAIWPSISAYAIIWTAIELSKQEKDLLERSQPNHHENKQDHGPNTMRMNASISAFSSISRCANKSI